MTCIAGVAKAGKVWIGGDSCGAEGLSAATYANCKVFKHGEFLYGFYDSFRGGQVLQHLFKEPERKRALTDEQYLVGPYAENVYNLFEKWSLLSSKGSMKTCWLLGYRGVIYSVEENLCILRSAHDYQAAGSGADWALGALHATPTVPPALRVRKALEAAEAHCGTVLAPFTVLSLGSKT